MKVQDISWKLTRLAEKMEGVSISCTTRIDWNCLTERERMLLGKVWDIHDKYAPNLPPDDVLVENYELFIKGIQLMARRAVDLFVSVMSKSFGDEIEVWFFKLHFYNFMEDLIEAGFEYITEQDELKFFRKRK